MAGEPLKQSPELVKAAIEQAEREAAGQAKQEAEHEIARATSDGVIAGRRAAPLSYARQLILGKLYNSKAIEGDEDAIMAAVYVLFGGPAGELAKLARKPEAFLAAAAEFADVAAESDYRQWAEYTADKVTQLGAASAMSEGDGPDDDSGGPGGNAHA